MLMSVSWVVCRAGASRPFPQSTGARLVFDDGDKEERDTLFAKYFNGFKFNGTTTINGDQGFDDSKRRVPSCPDALHN